MVKHRFAVRRRAFLIWQKLGFLPWSKSRSKSGKGAFFFFFFDSIPFLNDDAKRTFMHLLLRPGYMIRDYIRGQHERYLAPLTSLIIFYAFFALISSIVNPELPVQGSASHGSVMVDYRDAADTDSQKTTPRVQIAKRKAMKINQVIDLFDLDKHPERIDTPLKASLAGLESALRSQGVYLFLGHFLLLWLAMCIALRKREMSKSACAATAAYVLCQFCFFMFFSLFFGGKDKGEISAGLMLVLLTVDYRQLFDAEWKKGFGLAVKTGLWYGLIFLLLVALLVGSLALYVGISPGLK